jgi:hypothetical protein
MDRFAQLNTYHMTKFAYFLERLKATADGDGTLLDHALVLYGSSLSDGNQHNFSPLPIVLAGGASGQLKGGRHLQFRRHADVEPACRRTLNKLGAPTRSSATAPACWRSDAAMRVTAAAAFLASAEPSLALRRRRARESLAAREPRPRAP